MAVFRGRLIVFCYQSAGILGSADGYLYPGKKVFVSGSTTFEVLISANGPMR